MRAWIPVACLVLAGCSIVNDPGRHQGGQPALDAGRDAAPHQDAGTDAGPPLLPANEFCRAYAEVYCEGYFGCCSAAERPEDAFDECVSNAQYACSNGTDATGPVLGIIVADPRTGYDPRIAAEVIAEGRALVADCSTDLLRWTTERMGLQRGLTGSIEAGAECTPGPFVGLRFDFAALFSCEGTNRACVERSGQWDCLTRRDVDASCRLYWDCLDGLYCTNGVLGGTCQPRKANGGACSSGVECESLFCNRLGLCADPTQDDVYCSAS